MHTSTRLCAGDFRYLRRSPEGVQEVEFAVFAPNYHEQDRVGVVSLGLEDGVLHAGYALLALTTAFYDRMRLLHDDFFDYPQHFAFAGAEGAGVHAGATLLPLSTPKLWDAWSWLDVWPAAKWVTAPGDAASLLQRVFDYQINRLFWPRGLGPVTAESALPPHLWKMLKTSLKSVYLYGPEGDKQPGLAGRRGEWVEICGLPAAETLVQESIARLPAGMSGTPLAPGPQRYEAVAVDLFLAAIQG
jgi:hypothetical protein